MAGTGATEAQKPVATQMAETEATEAERPLAAQTADAGATEPKKPAAAQMGGTEATEAERPLADLTADARTTEAKRPAAAQTAETGTPEAEQPLAAQTADARTTEEAEPTDAAQGGGRGFFSSILDWFRGREADADPGEDGTAQPERRVAMQRKPVMETKPAAAPAPVEVEEETPQVVAKDITPDDVVRATQDLVAEIEVIRKAQRVTDAPRKAESDEDRAPVYAYAKSLEVMEKTARVQRRFGMIPVEIGRMPARDVQPADVYRHVQEIIEELRRVKRQLVIEEAIGPAGGEAPPFVYGNLGDASFLLDGLVGRPVTPNDLYIQVLQVHDEMALIAARLGVALGGDPPDVEDEKAPREIAQQILRATYKIVNLQSRLGMEASGVPDATLGEVTGAEVFDAVNVLLAELVRVKVHLNVTAPHGERREARGRKAAEVFAASPARGQEHGPPDQGRHRGEPARGPGTTRRGRTGRGARLMKSGALILGITVSAMLLAAAGTLYWMAASQGGTPYRAAIDQVREVQRLSSAWSVEIARVRADPLADFDSLAAFVPRMARLKEELAATAQGIPELSDRLGADVNMYLAVADAQEERIERFKTGYAVVRNSARYLPIAAANVARQAQEVGDGGLAQRIAALTQDMNLYLATPSDAGKGRLGEELGRLREASVGYAPPLANALANLLAHAEVLLERQAPTDALFEQATSDELSGLADRLAGALSREQGQREALARRFEQGILGLLAVLAVFWVVLAVQQRSRGTAEPAVAAGAEGAGAGGPAVTPTVAMAAPAAPGVEGLGADTRTGAGGRAGRGVRARAGRRGPGGARRGVRDAVPPARRAGRGQPRGLGRAGRHPARLPAPDPSQAPARLAGQRAPAGAAGRGRPRRGARGERDHRRAPAPRGQRHRRPCAPPRLVLRPRQRRRRALDGRCQRLHRGGGGGDRCGGGGGGDHAVGRGARSCSPRAPRSGCCLRSWWTTRCRRWVRSRAVRGASRSTPWRAGARSRSR